MGLLSDMFTKGWTRDQRNEYDRAAQRREWVGESPTQFAEPQVMPRTQAGLFGINPMTGQPDGRMDSPEWVYHPGSGLLGGQMTAPQYEARISTQTDNLASDWMRQNMANRQSGQNAQMAAQVNAVNARRSRVDSLSAGFDKEVAQYEPSIRSARMVDNLVEKGGYTNPMTGEAIKSAFLTTIRPGEAQMEGDVKKLAKAMGFRGQMKDFFAYLTSDPSRYTAHLEQMHDLIRKQAMVDQQQINDVRGRMRKAYQLDPTEVEQATWRGANPYVSPGNVIEQTQPATPTTTPGRKAAW